MSIKPGHILALALSVSLAGVLSAANPDAPVPAPAPEVAPAPAPIPDITVTRGETFTFTNHSALLLARLGAQDLAIAYPAEGESSYTIPAEAPLGATTLTFAFASGLLQSVDVNVVAAE